VRRVAGLVLVSIALTDAGSVCAQTAAPERGQSFPSRPIRLVVSTTAGGSPDLIARTISRQAEAYLGQTIIVDNRGGANGIIGTTIVINAPPDGHTVLHTAPAVLLNPLIYRKLPYDVDRDLVPVTCIAVGVGYLMLVSPTLPARTVREFVALAKQKPLTYSSSPVGSTTQIASELFNVRAGVQLLHVPYKGGNEAVSAVMGGEAHVTFSPPTAALPFVQSGKLRAIGFSGSKRFARLPDVPLISEAGVPDYVVDFTWNAWFAPAKTSPAIVGKLHAAVREALKAPKVQEFLDAAAFYPVGSTPEQFRDFVAKETKRYSQIVREAKIPPH
jgi:tripartite-type tricarboxylate transporter receptor subunit TctC